VLQILWIFFIKIRRGSGVATGRKGLEHPL